MSTKHPRTARTLILSFFTGALLLLGTTGAALPEHGSPEHKAAAPKPAKVEFAGDPYLLGIDPVTKKKLGSIETQKIVDFKGRELRFASAGTWIPSRRLRRSTSPSSTRR